MKNTKKEISALKKTIIRVEGNNSGKGYYERILKLVADYDFSWQVIYGYGRERRGRQKLKKRGRKINLEKMQFAISELKSELIKKGRATKDFGVEESGSFEGIIRRLYQTFDQNELYPAFLEKATHLFYFIIKNRPFREGNKCIASFLFLLFLEDNDYLYRRDGEVKLTPGILAILVLLVEASGFKEKEAITDLIVGFLEGF